MKRATKRRYIIGIDEVGRGALAGPVVVAAAIVTCPVSQITREAGILKDSKKLSAKQREAWVAYFKNHPNIFYVFARVYPDGIEKMNISAAANLAAYRAYKRLIANHKSLMANHRVFLDGGLYLKNKLWQKKNNPGAKTIVKGDEKIVGVMVASVVAKVHRDRFMRKLGKKWPGYGFEIHKGYGTKGHYSAIRKQGPSPAHRLTFLAKSNRI